MCYVCLFPFFFARGLLHRLSRWFLVSRCFPPPSFGFSRLLLCSHSSIVFQRVVPFWMRFSYSLATCSLSLLRAPSSVLQPLSTTQPNCIHLFVWTLGTPEEFVLSSIMTMVSSLIFRGSQARLCCNSYHTQNPCCVAGRPPPRKITKNNCFVENPTEFSKPEFPEDHFRNDTSQTAATRRKFFREGYRNAGCRSEKHGARKHTFPFCSCLSDGAIIR